MQYKYKLDKSWIGKIAKMEEFANGATQVSVRLKSGKIISKILISDFTYIIAARGYKDLPFSLDDIETIFQTEEDKNPKERGKWYFWDRW